MNPHLISLSAILKKSLPACVVSYFLIAATAPNTPGVSRNGYGAECCEWDRNFPLHLKLAAKQPLNNE